MDFIPNEFIPYGKQTIDTEDIQAVVDTLQSDFLTTGPKVAEFEAAICRFTGAPYAVAVSNGTAALHLASLLLLKAGDKVLTTPNSFLATSNAILYAGARPVFIDITSEGNIDLDLCEQALLADPTISALYAVHFSGNPVNQAKLKHLRDTYGIKILEDCAHSIGAVFDDVRAGSCVNSDSSILSFHPVKHLTTGEGGAITTSSKSLYRQLLQLRAHGIERTAMQNTDMAYDERGNLNPWYHEMHSLGFNYRITDFQCALGLTQFQKLSDFITQRKHIAQRYDAAFAGTMIQPLYTFDNRSSYHLYVIKIDFTQLNITKAELFMQLREREIGVQLHYIPINQQPYYRGLGYGGESTPVMDDYYAQCLSLPMYPSLSLVEQQYIIKQLLNILQEHTL